MSENLWTFCLFATYPKKLTTYLFFMVGIAFVVYLLDILDLQDIKMKKLIKVVVNVLSVMAGSHPAFTNESFSISGLWKSDSKRSGGALEIGFPDIVDTWKVFSS